MQFHVRMTVQFLTRWLYGDQAAGTVARETPLWQAWIQERFPMPTEPGKSECPRSSASEVP
jgi:hypothetical protein